MAYNLDRLISAIEKQNEQLGKLIQTNERLHSTPFDMTSIERIKMLSEEVAELGKKFDDSLSEANKHFSGLFTDKSKIINDLSEATKRLRDNLEKVQDEQNKLDKALQKISEHEEKFGKNINNMTASQQKYYKKLKAAADRYREQLKTEKEAYEENKDALTELRNASSEYYRKANEEQEKLNKRIVEGTHAMDDAAKKWEQRSRALRKGANEVSKGLTQIYQSTTKTLEPWAKANQEAMNYARTMGMSQKSADAYLSKTVTWAAKNNIGILFNKSTDELIKMQGKYSEVLGRNVQLTSEQKKDMLAMEQFLGEDGMMDIANRLENFGLGMSDSAEFIHEQMSEAQKSGIAASKLTKTIRENIKMAQDYTFKNGLDGLASMAKKAIELKTDMSLVNGFIEKTSTVEGAITTGAHLQVLGGSYAMGSDPLSMLYESLNNVEGLFDRATTMAQSKVFYNDKTGNFEMGAMERFMLKQAATTMGIDPSKLIDVAFRQASLSKIEGQARANDVIANDEDLMSMVKNLATWDNGRAVINIDGKDKELKDITAEDKKKLEAMQRTDSQNLQDMAISLRSMNEMLGGTQKEVSNEQAKSTEWAATGINGLLRQGTEMLDIAAKIGAWINIIGGGAGILGGVWTTAAGVLRMGKGVGNLVRAGNTTAGSTGPYVAPKGNAPVNVKSGILRGGRETIYTGANGGQYRALGGGRYQNISTGTISGSVKPVSSTTRFTGAALGQSALKGLKVGGVGALIGAGLSLGTDIATGEFKKDTGGSVGRAAGTAIGSVLGGVVGGPVGAMIGGWLGSVVTEGIQKAQKENRAKVRQEIASNLSDTMPEVAKLFDGENALEGNYNKRQLNMLKAALADNKIEEGELNYWTLRKLRANNDLVRMQEQGVDVRVAMANGGYLDGLKHSEGGMPIVGSDISVEGGEFVMNRRVTSALRPYLERMNKGDFSMIAKQPLGKQMRVSHHSTQSANMPHTSKLSMDPVSVNLSGTIKLDIGNKQVDISNELLNNPVFITKLSEMISKQINILDNGAYNKNIFKQKFA
jgi:hypothetical protein